MNKNLTNKLNSAFKKVHPQLIVNFTEIQLGKYEFEINLHDKQGKFQQGSSGEIVFSHIDDDRFINMVEGNAKGLTKLLANEVDIIPIMEGPFDLIIEHVILQKSLTTVDEFAAKLDSVSKRENLMVQEYIYKEIEKVDIEIENFPSFEKELFTLAAFQLGLSLPPMEVLGEALGKLVQNKSTWVLLSHWIKEWSGSSQWSMNEAWTGGPLIEELLAYGTFYLMEKEVNSSNKPEWWADLYIMVDICLDFTLDDLNKSGFIAK